MKNSFFAVTNTSVYKVIYDKDVSPYPIVEKIALKGKSVFPVGYKLQGGALLSIGRWLMMYVPEGGGMTSFERKIELVNTRYWGNRTSLVVALFDSEVEAMGCFGCDNLEPADKRWIESSQLILESIGDDHPVFVVSYYYDLKFGYVEKTEA